MTIMAVSTAVKVLCVLKERFLWSWLEVVEGYCRFGGGVGCYVVVLCWTENMKVSVRGVYEVVLLRKCDFYGRVYMKKKNSVI